MFVAIASVFVNVIGHLIFILLMFGFGIYASLKFDFKSIEEEFKEDE